MSRFERFNEGKAKLKRELTETYGEVDDEQFNEYIKTITNKRIGEYNADLFKRHRLPLLQEIFNWSQSHLSPQEFEETPFEEIMMMYFDANPSKAKLEDVEKFFDKSGEVMMIADPYDETPRLPDAELYNRTGEVQEVAPTPKSRPGSPEIPQSLKGMSSDEIGKLIKQAHSAGVKEE